MKRKIEENPFVIIFITSVIIIPATVCLFEWFRIYKSNHIQERWTVERLAIVQRYRRVLEEKESEILRLKKECKLSKYSDCTSELEKRKRLDQTPGMTSTRVKRVSATYEGNGLSKQCSSNSIEIRTAQPVHLSEDPVPPQDKFRGNFHVLSFGDDLFEIHIESEPIGRTRNKEKVKRDLLIHAADESSRFFLSKGYKGATSECLWNYFNLHQPFLVQEVGEENVKLVIKYRIVLDPYKLSICRTTY